jgi:alpha-2-macroglobulin
MWLHAFVTNFPTRARENKFDVWQKKFDAALERLRNLIANANEGEALSAEEHSLVAVWRRLQAP